MNNVCQILRCCCSTLNQFPQVRVIFEQIKVARPGQQQQNIQDEADLLSQVQVAIDQVETEGEPVTRYAICRRLGLKPGVRSRVKAIITQEIFRIRQQGLQQRQKLLESEPISPEESKLVASIQQAIASLKQSGRSVTISAICQIIPQSYTTLRSYPHIDFIFEQLVIDQYLESQRQAAQREQKLVQATQVAVAQLEAQNKLVSRKAIVQIVGVLRPTLIRYPRVKEILDSLPQKQAIFQQKQRQQREQQLATQVQTVIQKLELLNQPILLDDIARQVGMSATTLQTYPQVKEILQQVKIDSQKARIAKSQQRDMELAKETWQAAETLTQLGQPVTKRAIGQLVGLSLPAYNTYPQALAVLNQVVNND